MSSGNSEKTEITVEKEELEELIEEKVEKRVREEIQENPGTEEGEGSGKEMSRRSFLKKAGLGALGFSAMSLMPSTAYDIKSSDGLEVFESNTKYFDVNPGGPVEVKNANLLEKGSRVATRNWTNNNFNNYTDSNARSALEGSSPTFTNATVSETLYFSDEVAGDGLRMDSRSDPAALHKYWDSDSGAKRWREHWYDGSGYHYAWAASNGFNFGSGIDMNSNNIKNVSQINGQDASSLGGNVLSIPATDAEDLVFDSDDTLTNSLYVGDNITVESGTTLNLGKDNTILISSGAVEINGEINGDAVVTSQPEVLEMEGVGGTGGARGTGTGSGSPGEDGGNATGYGAGGGGGGGGGSRTESGADGSNSSRDGENINSTDVIKTFPTPVWDAIANGDITPTGSGVSGGSGGGGYDGDYSTGGGAGGNGGKGGAVLYIFAESITGSGVVSLDGGNGKDGENGEDGTAGGGGGGGGGGSGGMLIAITPEFDRSNLTISLSGGAGGTGGAGGNYSHGGGDGGNGTAGIDGEVLHLN